MSFEVMLTKWRGDVDVRCGFVAEAGLTVLFGASGAGKTSVLDMIAGLLRPDAGRVAVAGRVLFDSTAGTDLPPDQRRAGYVFQDARLFPHLSVRDNLTYGGGPIDARLDFLGIDHLLDRWPRSLSGGEARRVAIGRALLSDPEFLLLDEPLSSLDRARREEVMVALEHLRDHAGLPILLVTHDQAEAERLGNRIVEIG
ncbi:MAG: ATP-binding cassette domain-containing protein [Pseudomonadota bacterium]